MKILFVSLGCDKNRVDSEVMLGMLSQLGHEFTDDETIAVHIGGKDGMKFGLGTSLKSQIVALAMTDNLLDNRAHLVDLHREDDEMFALVLVLLACLPEALVSLLDAVVKDVGET